MAVKFSELTETVRKRLRDMGQEFAEALEAQGKKQRKKLDEIVSNTLDLDSIRDFDFDSPYDAGDFRDLYGEIDLDNIDLTDPKYRDLFEDNFPLADPGNVHHAIEQQVLRNKPWSGLFTSEQINSLNNLRGIPGDVNGPVHLSAIRRMWNQFYDVNAPDVGKVPDSVMRDRFTEFAGLIDDAFGSLFDPPIR